MFCIKMAIRGQPCGQVVKFKGSASVAQAFACSDSGHGHDTAHQAMDEAASHMPQLEGPITKIYNYLLGGFGEKKQGKKKKEEEEDWQQLLAQVPIFKKINKQINIGSSVYRW